MRSSILVLSVVAVSAFQLACQSEGQEDVGVIQLAIAAGPPGAACLRVTVTGPAGTTAVRNLNLTPGTTTTGTLQGLPLGQVGVRAEAFGVTCTSVNAGSIPGWVSDPVSVVLTPGTPVAVKLVMQRAGQINITVDWNTGGAGGGAGKGGAGGGGSGGGGAGGGGASGGSGGSTLLDVAKPLNGQMLLAPCKQDTTAATCATVTGACPVQNIADPALSGVLLTDKTLTLGGTPGTTYSITLHVQGEVEAKLYTGAIDQDGVALSPTADGFGIGGTPTTTNAYGVYLLRVTNPGSTTKTDYFLNSLQPPGVSNHTTYGIDYTATIQAQGGATIRLVAADSNCNEIKNCGPTQNDGSICAAPILIPNIDPVASSLNPTFNFNSVYNGQWIVMMVTSVTSP
jgi:hypothetical protein